MTEAITIQLITTEVTKTDTTTAQPVTPQVVTTEIVGTEVTPPQEVQNAIPMAEPVMTPMFTTETTTIEANTDMTEANIILNSGTFKSIMELTLSELNETDPLTIKTNQTSGPIEILGRADRHLFSPNKTQADGHTTPTLSTTTTIQSNQMEFQLQISEDYSRSKDNGDSTELYNTRIDDTVNERNHSTLTSRILTKRSNSQYPERLHGYRPYESINYPDGNFLITGQEIKEELINLYHFCPSFITRYGKYAVDLKDINFPYRESAPQYKDDATDLDKTCQNVFQIFNNYNVFKSLPELNLKIDREDIVFWKNNSLIWDSKPHLTFKCERKSHSNPNKICQYVYTKSHHDLFGNPFEQQNRYSSYFIVIVNHLRYPNDIITHPSLMEYFSEPPELPADQKAEQELLQKQVSERRDQKTHRANTRIDLEAQPAVVSKRTNGEREAEKDPEEIDQIEEEILLEMAKNGISTRQYGDGYLFDNIWAQLFVLDLPSFDSSLFQQIHSLDCIEFISLINDNITKDLFKGRTDGLSQILQDTCSGVEETIGNQINITIETARLAIDDFKSRQLSRNKREILTLVAVGGAIALGSLFVGWMSKNTYDINDLYNKFEGLSSQVDLNTKNTIILRDQLIGISNALAESNQILNKKIDLLANAVQTQIDSLAYILGQQIDKIASDQFTLAILTFHTLFKTLKVTSAQQTSTIILDMINVWDVIFGDLRRSVLSHSLVSWKNLKPILENIQESVESNYRLGIPFSKFELYYRFELINYQIIPETNKLFIFMQIPLSRPQRAQKFQLLAIRAMGIPCLGSLCSIFPAKEEAVQLLSIDQMEKLWVVNQNEIYREAQISDFSCILTGSGRTCFTFNFETLTIPTDCDKNIIHWNDTNVLSKCKFVQKSKREYMAIPLSRYRYVIHPDIIKKYTLICNGRENQEIKPQGFATLLEIPAKCQAFLADIDTTLMGPYDKRLFGSINTTLRSFHSTFMDEMKSTINDTQDKLGITKMKLSKNVNNLRAFDPDEYRLNFTFDNERLSAIATYLYQTQTDLNEMVLGVNFRMNNNRLKFSIWSYISILGDFIRVLTTLVVIFGLITHARLFGCFMSGIVILVPDGVEAWSEMMENTETSIANIILVIIFIILLMFYIKAAYFRTTIVSCYNGNTANRKVPSRFSLTVNISHRINQFRYIRVENIYIRVPLASFDLSVQDVRVVNPYNFWVIQNGVIKLANIVEIYGLNDHFDRIYERRINVQIPIKNIRWAGSEPQVCHLENLCNIAFVSILRKRTEITSLSEIDF